MRLHIVSDLHFEFHRDDGKQIARNIGQAVVRNKSDVLVVAGDLCTARTVYDSLAKLAAHCPVPILYVTGNHEHYGSSIAEVRELLKALPPTVISLDNSHVVIDGVTLLGGTGWFPHRADNHVFTPWMTDFRVVRRLAQEYKHEHESFRKCVDALCRPGSVVISHHLPSEQSVPERFKGSDLNRFFVGEFEDLVYDHEPALWIHGHTHSACDYQLHKTRVVCNPLGYPGESPNRYNFNKVIDL